MGVSYVHRLFYKYTEDGGYLDRQQGAIEIMLREIQGETAAQQGGRKRCSEVLRGALVLRQA